MKALLAALLLLTGCSSAHISYTRNGVEDVYKVNTNGNYSVTMTDHKVTVNTN